MTPSKTSQEVVSVSNGVEFFLIPRTELPQVESQGYYRPESRGLTIVEKDGRLFEVPLKAAATAVQSGYRDLLSRERLKPKKPEPTVPLTNAKSLTHAKLSKSPTAAGSVLPEPVALLSPISTPVPDDPIDSSVIVEAIERSKQIAKQVQQDREDLIIAEVGWRQHWLRFRFWINARVEKLRTQFGAAGVSMAVHVAMILMLASFYLANIQNESLMIMASPSLSDNVLDEFTLEPEQIEVKEPAEKEVSDASPMSEVVSEITDTVETPNFLAAVSGQAIKMPTGLSKSAPIPGEGMGDSKGKPTIFGSKFAAINYVFVIDNSNSMTKGRFETALIQLMLTVNNLTPKQRFYVIFYSDTAYGMMHPNTVPTLVPATPQNKVLLGKWLNTVPLCLQTNGRKAIQSAIDMKPDVIYVLGDGAFTDKAAEYFASKPTSVVMHTLGMEVKESDAKQFQLLATSHKGTYRDVGVMPEGAAMAAKYPRPRNSVRGPVWGITLKPEK
jgi:hypothetical protein